MGIFLDDMNKLLQTVSLIGVVLGGLFSVIRWFRSQQLKRNEYIYSLLEKITSDEDIIKGIYKSQYDDEWYEPSFHNDSDDNSFKLELQVDKVLSYFSYICFLHSTKTISSKEMASFDYYICSTLNNLSVQDYLFDIDSSSKTINCKSPFGYLIMYGIEKGIIDAKNFNGDY